MNPRTTILGGVLLLLCMFALGRIWLAPNNGPRTPEELLQAALAGSSAQIQEQAAAELTLHGEAEFARVRRLFQEGPTPQVRAIGCEALGNAYDYESMDALFAALDDASPVVRTRAAGAINLMLGRNYPYDAHAGEADRAALVKKMRADWEELRGDPFIHTFKSQRKQSP